MLDETPDFSLVAGGPIYQFFRRAQLSGPTLELQRRRVLFFSLLTWLPLLLLSALSGRLLGDAPLGFLRDIETHVKFLLIIPVFILAELVIHRRVRPAVKSFLERRMITSEDMPRFYAAIESATRLRNSIPIELALVIFVWTAGILIWRHMTASMGPTWYGSSDATGFHLRPAGYWYAFVSIPIFQLMLLRWYLRLFIWFLFLWRVSRLNLQLESAHPDRVGGLGFLGRSSYAFAPVLFAQGAMVSSFIANDVLFEGKSLLSYKLHVAIAITFFVATVLAPLVMFVPQLDSAKRSGLTKYGNLASDYAREFRHKWFREGIKADEILGSGDIQSLADLGNSFAVVREMRLVPFGVQDIVRLIVATAAPLAPLLLLIMPMEEVATRILKMIF
jgi:hypothetical protein